MTTHKIAVTVENFKMLDVIEQARLVRMMSAEDKNNRMIADELDISPAQVTNLSKIHDLPVDIKRLIKKNILSGTLILDLMRKYGWEEAIELLNRAITEYMGKNKITRTDILKLEGKQNSLAILRKFMANPANRTLVTDHLESFQLFDAILNDEAGLEEIENHFYGRKKRKTKGEGE